MESNATETLLERIMRTYELADLPAVLLNQRFDVLWASTAAKASRAELAQPEGARTMLNGYQIVLIRKEIDRFGVFTANHVLLCERPVEICAVQNEQEACYLMQPTRRMNYGTAMQPEGLMRAVTAFSAQTRRPLSSAFALLGPLETMMELLPQEAERLEARSYLWTLEQRLMQVLRASEQVMRYTTLSGGLTQPAPRYADLQQYLYRQLEDVAAPLFRERGMTLTYDLPQHSVSAAFDPELLQLVLFELFSNCARFTKTENAVHVRMTATQERAVITIQDSGAGIDAQSQLRAFEPYFSRDGGQLPFAGMGLGLPIARAAAALLGGSLACSSQAGEGAVFTLSLPLTADTDVPPLVETDVSYGDDRFSLPHVLFADSMPVKL